MERAGKAESLKLERAKNRRLHALAARFAVLASRPEVPVERLARAVPAHKGALLDHNA